MSAGAVKQRDIETDARKLARLIAALRERATTKRQIADRFGVSRTVLLELERRHARPDPE